MFARIVLFCIAPLVCKMGNKKFFSSFLLFPSIFLGLGYASIVRAADKYQNLINCDIHLTACAQTLSNSTITFEVTPKPVKAMHDLQFKVSIIDTSSAPATAPHIDLGMLGMNMGPNRVDLKPIGEGLYEGRGVIVRCPSGGKIWRATVTIPDLGQAEFIFDVIY